ncbi:MAG TPA: LPS export ABC transporter permease LptF [Desulfobacteraceae bacterium]|nr:LPS export ABC transporter permease LptF [Deltaproteobacteria bacterium]MBW2356450.1 LPS export ABC transporter permease LptF [Deltaproteobacteria bacterium]HDI60971.1 LPS export ABC transporter permease LptF [Desulfobacteraceae bacterium]
MSTLIDRYLLREFLPPFALNLVFFTFVFLMTRILEITNMVVNYRIGLGAVALMLVYATPRFLEFVVPMSVMMAILLTLLRLSGDNEIVALKAGGISVYRLLLPVMTFALIGCLITLLITLWAAPRGRLALKGLVAQATRATDLSLVLKERTFNDAFDGVMLFVSRIDPGTRELRDVFIEDRRHRPLKIAIVAPRGRLVAEAGNNAYHLELFGGTVHRVDLAGRTADTIGFESYEVALKVKPSRAAVAAPPSEDEMGFAELGRWIDSLPPDDQRYFSARLAWHQKLAIPAACLCLGFMALPLGIQSRTARRSFGLGLGLASFLAYYLLLSAGKILGEAGYLTPVVGMWLPNAVSAAFGFWLMARAARERPVQWRLWPMR